MQVGSEKQTLILAGEPVPLPAGEPRGGAGTQLQRVTMLLVQGEYGSGGMRGGNSSPAKALPIIDSPSVELLSTDSDDSRSLPALHARPYVSSKRTTGAAEYLRMQTLVGVAKRNQLIDVYA